MGYKKSFNLVTIQLIIPLSTMTKAEYKATYGIDLDDIDIEKVTLLQDEGSKNKYFVDEVKTTESGIDVYAGGNILSIGSSVSVVKNAYSVENAKPIYCHPISIVDTSVGIEKRLTMLIFNNSDTPFTLNSLKDFLDDLALKTEYVGKVMVSGSFVYESKVVIASYLTKFNSTQYSVIGLDTATGVSVGNTSTNFDAIFPSSTTFEDGVNKIN